MNVLTHGGKDSQTENYTTLKITEEQITEICLFPWSGRFHIV